MRHGTSLTGRSTSITGFYYKRFSMIFSKVPGLRIKVPELRVLPCDAFIIGGNVFPLYCK